MCDCQIFVLPVNQPLFLNLLSVFNSVKILYTPVMSPKLISWNVNGLRAVLKKDALGFIDREKPDVFCIQETRASPEQIDPILTGYPHQYWNSAEKRGYAGTAAFTRTEPVTVSYDMGAEVNDREGRIITLEYPGYYLVNIYTPNAKRDLSRLEYRIEWDKAFLVYLKKLERKKPVIFCGDLNVAHKEIDLANPESNHHNAGFTNEERQGFSNLIAAEFIDSFREFNQEGGHYTWWSLPTRARERNIGWRIDYFCLSKALRPMLKHAFILSDIMGADHCPIGIILKDKSS
ncbi:Exodeoxyribonuclease [subsurface metagenome]